MEKFTLLGTKLAAVMSLKPKMRAPLPREAVEVALANAWRTYLALDRQILALGGRVLLGKLTRKSPLFLA